jgi:hypothetical protein
MCFTLFMPDKPQSDRHKKIQFFTRLSPETARALRKLAHNDKRFLGTMIEILIEEAMEARATK